MFSLLKCNFTSVSSVFRDLFVCVSLSMLVTDPCQHLSVFTSLCRVCSVYFLGLVFSPWRLCVCRLFNSPFGDLRSCSGSEHLGVVLVAFFFHLSYCTIRRLTPTR